MVTKTSPTAPNVNVVLLSGPAKLSEIEYFVKMQILAWSKRPIDITITTLICLNQYCYKLL